MEKEKTYSEVRGEKPFDWNKALEIDCELMKDYYVLRGKSKEWITCACGNQCNIIPRNQYGAPEDKFLSNLGIAFFERIVGMTNYMLDNEYRTANLLRLQSIEILHKIEAKSAELINEIKNKGI